MKRFWPLSTLRYRIRYQSSEGCPSLQRCNASLHRWQAGSASFPSATQWASGCFQHKLWRFKVWELCSSPVYYHNQPQAPSGKTDLLFCCQHKTLTVNIFNHSVISIGKNDLWLLFFLARQSTGLLLPHGFRDELGLQARLGWEAVCYWYRAQNTLQHTGSKSRKSVTFYSFFFN